MKILKCKPCKVEEKYFIIDIDLANDEKHDDKKNLVSWSIRKDGTKDVLKQKLKEEKLIPSKAKKIVVKIIEENGISKNCMKVRAFIKVVYTL